ncbi:MAG: hypothetical protein EBR52_07765 [Microbacteriaceae bacterium]|nr:hypothetical protein [Microbacteriaceae bacterium]
MADVTLNDILVKLEGLSVKQDLMMTKLDELSKISDQHWKRINEIETKLALLEQRQPPRVHVSVWILATIAVLGFIASFVTFVTK